MEVKYTPQFEIRFTDTDEVYKLNIFYDDTKDWDKKAIKEIKELENKMYKDHSNFGRIIDDIEFKCGQFGLGYHWFEHMIVSDNKPC